MSEKPLLSATQVSSYRDCARSYAFTYLYGFREPPAASAQLGTRVHEILEDWLRDGKEPDVTESLTLDSKYGAPVKHWVGQIARAGLGVLPPPGLAHVEGKFYFTTEKARWQGARDAVVGQDAQGKWKAPELGDHIVIVDHKTSGQVKRWAKTKQDLATDVQANLYAFATAAEFQTDKVSGLWNYLSTSGKHECFPVRVSFDRDRVLEQIAAIDDTAEKLYTLRTKKPPAQDVEPNYSACGNYGGCRHRERCGSLPKGPLTPSGNGGTFWSRLSALDSPEQEGTEMELPKKLSDILAAKALEQKAMAQAAGLPPPPPPPPAAPEEDKTWLPGDPLNQTQQGKLALGKSLQEVALAADLPPDLDSVYTWPNRKTRYADVIAGLEAAKALENEELAKIRSETLPPPPPPAEAPILPGDLVNLGTPIGQPERGFINSPEAPAVAFKSPEELLAYQAAENLKLGLYLPPAPPAEENRGITHSWEPFTDRERAKKEAVRLALVDEGCSFRLPRLNEILSEYHLKGFTPSMTEGSKALAQEISEKYKSFPPPPPMPGTIAARASSRPHALGHSLVVIFSAMVTKGSLPVMHFSDVATRAAEKVKTGFGIEHYALADYGKGQAAFAVEVEKELALLPAGTVLYADLRSRETQDAVAVLERAAGLVLRGH